MRKDTRYKYRIPLFQDRDIIIRKWTNVGARLRAVGSMNLHALMHNACVISRVSLPYVDYCRLS